ncbi:hypothetical protein ACYPKM_03425 [Pseudomonas aeruginosa]
MNFNSTNPKDELRKRLDEACAKFTGETLLYAAERLPEKMHPNRKIPNLREENYRSFVDSLSSGPSM